MSARGARDAMAPPGREAMRRRLSPGKVLKAAPSVPCLAPCVNDANTMGVHSPFATTIWDYINRGMPLGKEGSLTPNEVYALTAFLLYKNDVIKEDEVMDAQSLPKVKMPNRDGAALPPEWKHGGPGCRGTLDRGSLGKSVPNLDGNVWPSANSGASNQTAAASLLRVRIIKRGRIDSLPSTAGFLGCEHPLQRTLRAPFAAWLRGASQGQPPYLHSRRYPRNSQPSAAELIGETVSGQASAQGTRSA